MQATQTMQQAGAAPHENIQNSCNGLLTTNQQVGEQIIKTYLQLKECLIDDIQPKQAFTSLKKLAFLYGTKTIDYETAKIKALYDLNLVPHLIKKLYHMSDLENGTKLQNACLWFLANVMALFEEPEIVEMVDQHQVFPQLYTLLQIVDEKVIEQTLWVISNLVSHSPVKKLAVEKYKLVQVITLLIKNVEDKNLTELFTRKMNKTLCWLISNIVRKPCPRFEDTKLLIPYLAYIIHFEDQQIMKDACSALGNIVLTDGNSREDDQKQIEEVLQHNIAERIIMMTQHINPEIQSISLVLLGHLSYGNEIQTDYLLDLGILQALVDLLDSNSPKLVKKEALFTLSNIIAGSQHQIQRVIDNDVFDKLKELMTNGENQLLIDECIYCFMNATYHSDVNQAQWFVDNNHLKLLCEQYLVKDSAGYSLGNDLKESIKNIVVKAYFMNQDNKNILEDSGLIYLLNEKNNSQ